MQLHRTRDTSSSSVSAWDVSHCQLSLRDPSKPNFKLQSKNGHVRRITMYRHLICPDEFWHVSDTRIGHILNPDCLNGSFNFKENHSIDDKEKYQFGLLLFFYSAEALWGKKCNKVLCLTSRSNSWHH